MTAAECVPPNTRRRIRWLQVRAHVRGLLLCPIVCGQNRQMNNQPAVSLESTTVYRNLTSSSFSAQPGNCVYLFVLRCIQIPAEISEDCTVYLQVLHLYYTALHSLHPPPHHLFNPCTPPPQRLASSERRLPAITLIPAVAPSQNYRSLHEASVSSVFTYTRPRFKSKTTSPTADGLKWINDIIFLD